MEYLIYVLERNPTQYLRTLEGLELTTDEASAIIYDSEEQALMVIDTLDGTTEFWGTRQPRPKGN